MKVFRKVAEKIIMREHQQLVSITCDLCQTVTARNWREDHYDAVETNVRLRTGYNWPEGGSGETTTIDICPKCFETKLIPWVKEHGGEPTVKEWET